MSVQNKKVIGVIPARYGSTRFPGKPLALINGKPLLQWVIEGVQSSEIIKSFIVATDDQRIIHLVEELGGNYNNLEAVMTDHDLPTGTDRVWQAAKNIDCDVVVNIQGDEPLIRGDIIDQLCQPFLKKENLDMATLGREFTTVEEVESVNTAKIVLNQYGEAVYFSRYPIPYSREKLSSDGKLGGCLKHIGMYAYSKSFLQKFCKQEPVAMEKLEGLEQLRALHLGAKIEVVRVDSDSWGVDTLEDINKIENLMLT